MSQIVGLIRCSRIIYDAYAFQAIYIIYQLHIPIYQLPTNQFYSEIGA